MQLRKQHIDYEENEGHPDEGGDGYWIHLKPGFKWAGDPVGAVHAIHEDTKEIAHQEGVLPCKCAGCKAMLAR